MEKIILKSTSYPFKLMIKDIIEIFVEKKSIPKKVIYNYCLKLKNEK